MAKKELNQMRTEVELALKLLDSETADEIIGEPEPEEHKILVRGVKSVYRMLWAMARGNGMKQTPQTSRMGAQALLMLATIVHYAYALGIRRGNESANQRISEETGGGDH